MVYLSGMAHLWESQEIPVTPTGNPGVLGCNIVCVACGIAQVCFVAIPAPSCADEASLLLAQFRPSRRTPQELRRLLEARANPDIVVATEIWGTLCTLSKVIGFAKAAHVPRIIQSGLSMDLQGSLCTPPIYPGRLYAYLR